MNNDLGGMLICSHIARKAIEAKFDNKIVREKPSIFKKLWTKLTK
ncbi:hypothetical protein [Vibrio gallicus]|nr:hypothetical protein [Vibrio gallicus]